MRADFANVESVVNLVLERTHLDDPDQGRVDDALLVQFGQERREVIPNEVGFVVSGRVERRECETSNSLK